jgi:hypothetical protein
MHGVVMCTGVLRHSLAVSECSDNNGAVQAVNEDGKLAWSRVTVLRSFWPQLLDTPFLRMTTAAGQVCTCCLSHERPLVQMDASAATVKFWICSSGMCQCAVNIAGWHRSVMLISSSRSRKLGASLVD